MRIAKGRKEKKSAKILAIFAAAATLALLLAASGFETARPRTPAEAAPPGWSHHVLPLRAGSKGVGAFPPEGGVEIQSLMGTAFTYQGRLIDGGNPANGEYDFEFKLYDASSDGTQIGSAVTKEDVTVTDGLFTVKLDFGSGAFNGDTRWLEIGVRPEASPGAYTTLDSRQELTPAPYALALPRSSSPYMSTIHVGMGLGDVISREANQANLRKSLIYVMVIIIADVV